MPNRTARGRPLTGAAGSTCTKTPATYLSSVIVFVEERGQVVLYACIIIIIIILRVLSSVQIRVMLKQGGRQQRVVGQI
jgi:hypothetical protein